MNLRVRLASPLVGLLIAAGVLAATEGLFRAAAWGNVVPYELMVELNPGLRFRNRPHLHEKLFTPPVNVTTDGAGFRARQEVQRHKPTGVRRLIAMGDSITFGYGVDDAETYPARLEYLLNERRRSASAVRYEVINAGVVGYSSAEGLRQLARDLLVYRPDVLLVSYAINDPDYALRPFLYGRLRDSRTGRARLAMVARNWLFAHSHVGRWVIDAVAWRRYRAWHHSHLDDVRAGRIRSAQPEEYVRNLRAFVRIARTHGCQIVFFVAPVRLKWTPYPPAGFLDTKDPRHCREAASFAELALAAGVRTPEERSSLAYFRARARENLGQMERARGAYLDAMRDEGAPENWRWLARQYSRLMRRVAEEERVPVADLQATFEERELTDNPSGLFIDMCHPGPVGTRLIAEEVAKVLGSAVLGGGGSR